MKISISYPPIESPKGVALLSQNRQFQYFNAPTFIYPVIPAYAASLLKREGYDVIWDDAIAESLNYKEWMERLEEEKPDIIAIESKTPTIKKYWQIIRQLKNKFPEMTVVLMGDHVTALPEESMRNCPADYVMTGGDFDFSLLNLANHLDKGEELKQGVYSRSEIWQSGIHEGVTENNFGKKIKSKGPVKEGLTMAGKKYEEPLDNLVGFTGFEGYYYEGPIENTGKFQADGDVTTLPLIDRELTKWELYAYHNGNYKHFPGTYTMIGRDCWWRKDGGCTFCSWTSTFPTFRCGTVEHMLDDVERCIEMGIREIFDDTGTFPIGKWLDDFCKAMIERGYNKKIKIGCNMRPGALTKEQYAMMGEAGFRFILYGLESGNQKSIDMLNKGTKAKVDITDAATWATAAGCDPHVTCMVGYPWETKEEAIETVELNKKLFKEGRIETLQATIVIPYPGTHLFRQCLENDWLRSLDWDDYDMRKPVMKCPMPDEEVLGLSQGLYKSFLSPSFIWRKVREIRSLDDLKFFWIGGKKVLGHLLDFSKKENEKYDKVEK